jgi:hypothetical protein
MAILSNLKNEFGDHRTTAREICNELNKARDDFPDGRTPIEALIWYHLEITFTSTASVVINSLR